MERFGIEDLLDLAKFLPHFSAGKMQTRNGMQIPGHCGRSFARAAAANSAAATGQSCEGQGGRDVVVNVVAVLLVVFRCWLLRLLALLPLGVMFTQTSEQSVQGARHVVVILLGEFMFSWNSLE
jgi:hypothetical protein